jgi:hypothetical protein
MSEMKKITLVYDYVYETFKGRVAKGGTSKLNEIFNEDGAISKSAMDEILILMLKEAGIQSENRQVSYQIGNLDTMELLYDDTLYLVEVTLETGETYIIDIYYAITEYALGHSKEYDRFLVGNKTIENHLKETYLENKGIAEDAKFYTEVINIKVNPTALSKTLIIANLPEGMSVPD